MPQPNDAYTDLKNLVEELGRAQERDVLRVEGGTGLPGLALPKLIEYAAMCGFWIGQRRRRSVLAQSRRG